MSDSIRPRVYTLPLFPLHSVLFPHLPVQLHIFEERYKTMINGCIDKGTPFGVVLIREGCEVGTPAVPYEIGCVAVILEVERMQDGRMNLLAAGERRFRLLEYMEAEEPYLVGRVEEIQDEIDDETGVEELHALFTRYLTLLAECIDEPMPEIPMPEDASTLSFCVAAVAMLTPEEKQRLLEMTRVSERVSSEIQWLREQVAELQEARNVPPEPRRVLIARPLDLTSEPWEYFTAEARN
jgi:Lon protease-like protein